jgi:uncharacterized peroxidase-related enzyme
MSHPERYPLADLADVPDDIRQTILDVQQKAGFIPNVFLILARRPAEFRAFFSYYDAIMKRPGSTLSAADKEMIIVAISVENGCSYCVAAHGALLRVYSKQPLLTDQIVSNYRHAPLTQPQRAMLDFAFRLSRTPAEVGEDDYLKLYAVGFDDEDIWDIAGVTSFFGMSNRMAIVQGVGANPEFYSLGR